MIDEWDGKEIIYPDDLVFTTMGEDTVKWFLKDSRYTIVTYADSIGCMGCKLKLPAWKDFISYLDSVSDHTKLYLFFILEIKKRWFIFWNIMIFRILCVLI